MKTFFDQIQEERKRFKAESLPESIYEVLHRIGGFVHEFERFLFFFQTWKNKPQFFFYELDSMNPSSNESAIAKNGGLKFLRPEDPVDPSEINSAAFRRWYDNWIEIVNKVARFLFDPTAKFNSKEMT